VPRLAAAGESVRAMRPGPDAVLVSGDLTESAAEVEYEQVRKLLAPLEAPLYVLPGNHDDRDALRSHFELPGGDGSPVLYSADLGPLRLVALDSTLPGEDRGELDSERLAWLDSELAAAGGTPTVLALHHPPLSTGIRTMDEIGLPIADRRALGAVLERHPQVLRLVTGHVHRTIAGELAGRTVLVAPSTYVQTKLDFQADEFGLVLEPAGFAVHALLDGAMASHVKLID
jgi:3',5'-cyclic-AMP phosphodiesterase